MTVNKFLVWTMGFGKHCRAVLGHALLKLLAFCNLLVLVACDVCQYDTCMLITTEVHLLA